LFLPFADLILVDIKLLGQLRLEGAVAITRRLNLDFTMIAFQGLAAVAIAAIAGTTSGWSMSSYTI